MNVLEAKAVELRKGHPDTVFQPVHSGRPSTGIGPPQLTWPPLPELARQRAHRCLGGGDEHPHGSLGFPGGLHWPPRLVSISLFLYF